MYDLLQADSQEYPEGNDAAAVQSASQLPPGLAPGSREQCRYFYDEGPVVPRARPIIIEYHDLEPPEVAEVRKQEERDNPWGEFPSPPSLTSDEVYVPGVTPGGPRPLPEGTHLATVKFVQHGGSPDLPKLSQESLQSNAGTYYSFFKWHDAPAESEEMWLKEHGRGFKAPTSEILPMLRWFHDSEYHAGESHNMSDTEFWERRGQDYCAMET